MHYTLEAITVHWEISQSDDETDSSLFSYIQAVSATLTDTQGVDIFLTLDDSTTDADFAFIFEQIIEQVREWAETRPIITTVEGL